MIDDTLFFMLVVGLVISALVHPEERVGDVERILRQ
jgi:hypothetical protein